MPDHWIAALQFGGLVAILLILAGLIIAGAIWCARTGLDTYPFEELEDLDE